MGCDSISKLVTLKCVEEFPDFISTQLCVLSNGMCIESVASRIILEKKRRNHEKHLYFVVVPDRLPYHLMTSFANSLRYFINSFNAESAAHSGQEVLDNDQLSDVKGLKEDEDFLPVHVLREGASPKERCATFQQSGVIISTSRMLCADLLHKRLSPIFVSTAVVCLLLRGFPTGESALASIGFFIEILLRGEHTTHLFNYHAHESLETRTNNRPQIVILSDNPATVHYLVSRRAVGREKFMQAMHVGDIQLFPSFRLSVIKHFEQLSKKKPLTLDRMIVNVTTSTRILDALLQKILREVLSELCKVQERLHQNQGNSNAHKRESSSSILQDDLKQFQPLVRLRLDPISPTGDTCGLDNHLTYQSSYASKHHSLANKADGTDRMHSSPDYLGVGAWRSAVDEAYINFGRISDEVCLDNQSTDLDADLQMSLQSNAPDWPFGSLVESFLDLRHLRRRLWSCSRYDFFFVLLSVLRRRRRGGFAYKPRVEQAAAAFPTASWTMSSSFNDVVTVATERVGKVVVHPTASPSDLETAKSHPTWSIPSANKVESVSEEDEVVIVEPKSPTPPPSPPPSDLASSSIMSLLPNAEDPDPELEVAHRMTLSWVRGALRKPTGTPNLGKSPMQRLDNGLSRSPPHAPGILVVAFGYREVTRLVERFMYTREDFLKLQLNHFLRRYQAFYGVSIQHEEPRPSNDGEALSPRELSDWVETVVAGEEMGDNYRDCILISSDEDSVSEDGKDKTSGESSFLSNGVKREEDASPLGSLHPILMSQAEVDDPSAPPGVVNSHSTTDSTNTVDPSSSASRFVQFRLEAARLGRVVLTPVTEDSQTNNTSDLPRVVVSDGNDLRAGELLALLRGESTFDYGTSVPPPSLCVSSSYENRNQESGNAANNTSTSDISIAIRRIILVRHHIAFLRTLETVHDELEDDLLRALKVQLISTIVSENESKATVEKEKLAFKALAHVKATFTSIMLADRASVRDTEAILESGNLTTCSRRLSASNRPQSLASNAYPYTDAPTEAITRGVPFVLFDEREFRSMLPYFLYKQNLDLVPLTLATADYVLSPQYGMERKSVSDYTQSLQSGRIHRQLAALSRRYERALLLIEFCRHQPFRLVRLCLSPPTTADLAYMRTLYTRTARLLLAYPQVTILWSRSAAHSAAMLARLKKTVAIENKDPSDPSLTVAGGVGTNDEDEEYQRKELSIYAARVFSRFPGVTPANKNQLMHLCGSLAGLAAISQATLVDTIGEVDGMKLYSFLHSPLIEAVD
ncbi:unnamed protein product [Phytomonas sp. Hart1]|nr:unnamed protein product [Phytomonas sp. Hart1]|eukprot:CCW68532.1 unnamed protein product [Phytomonas sp. isolate Hart1]